MSSCLSVVIAVGQKGNVMWLLHLPPKLRFEIVLTLKRDTKNLDKLHLTEIRFFARIQGTWAAGFRFIHHPAAATFFPVSFYNDNSAFMQICNKICTSWKRSKKRTTRTQQQNNSGKYPKNNCSVFSYKNWGGRVDKV